MGIFPSLIIITLTRLKCITSLLSTLASTLFATSLMIRSVAPDMRCPTRLLVETITARASTSRQSRQRAFPTSARLQTISVAVVRKRSLFDIVVDKWQPFTARREWQGVAHGFAF